MTSAFPGGTAYLAPEGFLPQLLGELTGVYRVVGRLVLAAGPVQAAAWAEHIWADVEQLEGVSIGSAAKALKARQRNWWPYASHLHRRHTLIQQQLPHVAQRPLVFPDFTPRPPLGAYALLDEHTLLFSQHCSSPFANGALSFAEPPGEQPPSRAYLKLWEAFTRLGVQPKAGETCLDLGASPGGWTWVLANTGAKVTSFDRAPLDPALLARPNVTAVVGDAFQAKPARVGALDWLCSDVICYPDRLLALIQEWLDSGLCRNFVCTIKFQGDQHYAVIKQLHEIPGSQLMHLFHNKHELTWVRIAP